MRSLFNRGDVQKVRLATNPCLSRHSPFSGDGGCGPRQKTAGFIGLPQILGGSASTTVLSGSAQGSLALRPAMLLQPLRLTFVPRASAGRSTYPTAWVATGMNRQFPGRYFHPLVTCAFVAHQDIVVHRNVPMLCLCY